MLTANDHRKKHQFFLQGKGKKKEEKEKEKRTPPFFGLLSEINVVNKSLYKEIKLNLSFLE